MTRTASTSLIWLRRDLRLADNPAICAGLARPGLIQVAFVFDTDILSELSDPADRRVEFIFEAIRAIDEQLRQMGGYLHVCHGHAVDEIVSLANRLKVDSVFAARDYEPAAIERDQKIATALEQANRQLVLVKDHVVFEPWELETAGKTPYTVFTPYKKKWLANLNPRQLEPLRYKLTGRLQQVQTPPETASLESLGFVRTNLAKLNIKPNESAAFESLQEFSQRMGLYEQQRNFPAIRGVSYLSVHLRFGTLSIRQAAFQAWQLIESKTEAAQGAATWLSELIWRDFYFQILYHFPHVVDRAFKPAYDQIKWTEDTNLFDAWCKGQTGYPLVDAAMRQINDTGYMHNRLRMIVASFLTKDLGIDWKHGEKYFARKLNDFDLSANNGGWQWAASSGCDAQPYFRIFNPVTQSRRFDPNGGFIRRYLPELENLSDKQIHEPWLVTSDNLTAAGIKLGKNYPLPIVAHDEARIQTLARYAVVKKPKAP